MKERPILFSGPMVRRILDGSKTQTRRVILPEWSRCLDLGDPDDRAEALRQSPWQRGDHLWVREGWRTDVEHDALPPRDVPRNASLVYQADEPLVALAAGIDPGRYRHARFMPRWASRITLEITEVRVERLQAISEEDARAEGAVFHDGHGIGHSGWRHDPEHGVVWSTARESFAMGWNSINGKRPGCAWKDDPWVWAISFKRVHR